MNPNFVNYDSVNDNGFHKFIALAKSIKPFKKVDLISKLSFIYFLKNSDIFMISSLWMSKDSFYI